MRIKSIKARQILNGSGHPTIEVEVSTSRNFAISSVPLASTKSKFEFTDIYDNHNKRFNTETLNIVIDNIEKVVGPELIGKNSMDQELIDKTLVDIDGSYNRTRLGVNVLTVISQAIAKLGALESELPLFKYIRVLYDFTGNSSEKLNSTYLLPIPIITLYKNFVTHDKEVLPFQEIMLLGKSKFKYLRDLLKLYEQIDNMHISNIEEFKGKSLLDSIEKVNKGLQSLGLNLDLGVDIAASRFYRPEDESYVIPNIQNGGTVFKGNFKKLISIYKQLHETGVHYIEDPFAEDDYAAWKALTDYSTEHKIHLDVVSDDLTATNTERLSKVFMLGASNHVSVKPTQIGTLSETIQFIQLAKHHGMYITVAYRNGETEDSFISDLACGVNAEYIRTGYFRGSEYVCKLNRLTQIEQILK